MTVSHIKVTGVLTLEEPMHVGDGVQVGVVKGSLPYIPGSVLRGAFGAAYLKLKCSRGEPLADHSGCPEVDDCDYVRLFGDVEGKASNIFFRYLYPVHLRCGGTYLPAPRTLYVCENSQCGETIDGLYPPMECITCKGRVKPYSGYVCNRCGDMNRAPIKVKSFTSTAVDRVTGGAAMVPSRGGVSGTLHVTRAIGRGSRFRFELILSPKVEDLVEDVVRVLTRALPEEGLGGHRSRGYGKVSLSDVEASRVDASDVERRAEMISAGCFSLRAASPLVVDGPLEASAVLEGARRAYSWVFHEGKPVLPALEAVAIRASRVYVGGWSERLGAEARRRAAYAPGSVFQYRCSEPSSVLSKALAALEVYPLGGLKPHGCGQLLVEGCREGSAG